MITITEFEASLQSDRPGSTLTAPLKSLWYDAKGDWHQAHAQVDHLADKESAWVHAYLHRKEGDTWNAGYWYKKAGKTRPELSLDDEWRALVAYFTFNT